MTTERRAAAALEKRNKKTSVRFTIILLTTLSQFAFSQEKSLILKGDKSSLEDSIQIIDNSFANNPFNFDRTIEFHLFHLPVIYSQNITCKHAFMDSENLEDSLCTATNGTNIFKYYKMKGGNLLTYVCIKDNSVGLKFNLKIGDSRKSVCEKFEVLKNWSKTIRKIRIGNNDDGTCIVILEFRDEKLYSVEYFPYDG